MTPRPPYTHPDQLPRELIAQFTARASAASRRGDCLIWPGSLDRHGYGSIRHRSHDDTWTIGTHRLAKMLELGELPDWAVIDHLCRVRDCFEVAHLRLVTSAENTACGNAGQPRAHCKSGHPLSGDNLHLVQRSNGDITRCCRRCRYLAKQRYRRRQAAA